MKWRRGMANMMVVSRCGRRYRSQNRDKWCMISDIDGGGGAGVLVAENRRKTINKLRVQQEFATFVTLHTYWR